MTAVETFKPSASGPHPWPMSIEAYRALGEMGLIPKQAELLYGQVFHKMSKSPLQTFVVLRLAEALRKCVNGEAFVSHSQPLSLGDSEPEPDLAIVRGSIEDYATEHPSTAELVVEVCVSTHEYDRSKLRAYSTAGVKECWIVLCPEKQIEVYRNPLGGSYQSSATYGLGGRLATPLLPSLELDLEGLFKLRKE